MTLAPADLDGQRRRFTATLNRACTYAGWPTVRVDSSLTLTDVNLDGQPLPDPLPMDDGVWSRNIASGAQISFDARVSLIKKPRRGAGAYRLTRPSVILLIQQPGGEWLPPDKDAPDALASDIDAFLVKRGNKNRRCRMAIQEWRDGPIRQCLRLAQHGKRGRNLQCESCQKRNDRLAASLPDDIPEGWQPRRFAGPH